MTTTEEKVTLLKKCQREFLNKGNLSTSSTKQLAEYGLLASYFALGSKEPKNITKDDINTFEK